MSSSRTSTLAGAGLALATFASQGCGSASPGSVTPAVNEPEAIQVRQVRRGIAPGESGTLDGRKVEAFAHFDQESELIRIGFIISADLIENPPMALNPVGSSFDVNGDGLIGPDEQLGEYRLALDMPLSITSWDKVPFKWLEIRWRPTAREGEDPPWPHFEFLFYTAPEESIDAIRTGACGVLIDCDDFKAATMRIPSKYVPSGYVDKGFAFPRSGNHLYETIKEEPPDPDSHRNFTYGAYGGKIVFYGPKLTVDFLKLRQEITLDIELPEAWAVSGFYPTVYGTYYARIRNDYIITLEKFVYREGE